MNILNVYLAFVSIFTSYALWVNENPEIDFATCALFGILWPITIPAVIILAIDSSLKSEE